MSQFRYSIPFLGTNIQQLPTPEKYGNTATEAVIFKGADLQEPSWSLLWENIQTACQVFGEENVTFHFPVDDADYTADLRIFNKLQESYQRCCDLGLFGMVVHSNRVREFSYWKGRDLGAERQRVIEKLNSVRSLNSQKHCWLGLENMPVMDNYGIEIDPLFVFPDDFQLLEGSEVGIVWDICHFNSSRANIASVIKEQQKADYYPNIQVCDPLDFLKLKSKIVHWHFSAFSGVADPDTGAICKEGVLPNEGTLEEKVYRDSWQGMQRHFSSQIVVFEIQEEDYTKREKASQMIQWCEAYHDES